MKVAIAMIEKELEALHNSRRRAETEVSRAKSELERWTCSSTEYLEKINGLDEALTHLRAQQALKEHTGNAPITEEKQHGE